MAEEWFYTQNGQQNGPVAFETLQQLAMAGQVKPADLIWKQGMATWTAASAVPGVFQQAAPMPQAPPPPNYNAGGFAPPGYAPPGGYQQPQGGFAPPMQYATPQGAMMGKSYLGMAVTAMILGIVSILTGGFLSILAIIFASIAMSGMGKSGNTAGKGMAITGLVLGILGMLEMFIYVAAMSRH